MDQGDAVEQLVGLSLARARAEAAEWAAMVRFRESELARIARIERPMQRLVETSGIATELALAVGLSEGQVVHRLTSAVRLTENAPRTWLAFMAGRLDAARATEIALALGRLERAESRVRLDDTVVPYAETHTVAEFRAWLKRFVTQVEADLAVERAEHERAKRHVPASASASESRDECEERARPADTMPKGGATTGSGTGRRPHPNDRPSSTPWRGTSWIRLSTVPDETLVG